MKRIYIISIVLILITNFITAQTDRQFWFVAPEVTYSHTGADTPIYFRITAGSLGANVTISMPANTANFPTQNHTILPNTTVTVNLSAFKSQIENTYDNLDGVSGKSNKGIYIESTNPITVYYEVSMTNNCDIFPLKGMNALGTEFWSIFQTKGYNMTASGWAVQATSSIDIVATEDGTVVTIESPLASQNLYFYGTANFSINLDKGETFSITPRWISKVPTGAGCALEGPFACDIFGRAAADHLSGLRITSNANHPIAITKKDDSVRHSCVDGWTGGCYDLMGEQYVPLDILGLEYIAMKGGLTTAPENVYIVATENATNIYINGNPVAAATINRGQTYICETLWNPGSPFVHIRADKKVSAMHVSGFGCEVGAAILPPTDKCTGSTKVSVTRSTNEGFFFNLMVWSGAEDSFYINGVLQDDSPGTLFGPADFIAVPGSANWKIWRSPNLPTATFPVLGVFTFENTEDVFHLGLINGGTGSGCRFGYFSDFNELRVDAQATGSLSSSIRACSYEKIQLYAQGGTDYMWWPAGYLDDPTSSTPIADPPADTIMLFYVEVSGACDVTDTATVSVEKFPELETQFSINQGYGCSPLELTLHEVSTQIKEKYWDFNFTNIAGFPDRDTTILPGALNYNTDVTFNHTFTNTSNEPLDTAQTYLIRLLAKNTNDCSDTAWASVNVYPEVTADFTISALADTIGCSPHLVQFVNNSNNEDANSWRFGDGVSDFTANPNHVFTNILNNDTIYTTRLVARSNFFCRDTAYLDIKVHPYIENGFTINKDEGCSPLDVTFTNGSVFADTIFLDFGDGKDTIMTTFTTVTHTYRNTGTTVLIHPIEMLVKNEEGCFEMAYDTVIVYPEIRANYTIDGNNYTGCNTRNVSFTNTSNYGIHTANTFLWNFGDGSTSNLASPTKVYNNTTTSDQNYTFNLRAQSQYGCYDDTSRTITIYRADADFNVNTDEGCSVLAVSITNTSEGDNIPVVGGWLWSYGDGANVNTEQPGTHIHNYTNTENPAVDQPFNLSLTVTRNASCFDTKTTTITVNPSIVASFTTNPAAPVRICDSILVTFTAALTVPTPGTTYSWDFGDGTSATGNPVTHIYRNLIYSTSHTYTATLTATTASGCTSISSAPIVVYPKVKAEYTIDNIAGCSPLTINAIANQYLGIPATNYQWTLNGAPIHTGYDPAAYTLPANPPGDNDIYTLRLNVSDLSGTCNSFMEKTITVYDAALADFNPKNSFWCNPDTVTFDNLSLNASTYAWDFGNGSTSSVFEPTQIFTNSNPTSNQTFPVKLDVTSNEGCTSSTTTNLTVYPFIKADFYTDKSEGCSPLRVTFTNSSTGPVTLSYNWTFENGDPATSSLENPGTVEFVNNSGITVTIRITLTITGPGGCTSVKTMDIDVFSSVVVNFTSAPADPVIICDSTNVVFTPTLIPLVGGTTYSWNFGDGTSGASTGIANQSHLYRNLNNTTSATYPASVLAETPEGCISMITKNVVVRPYVKSTFTIDKTGGCSPDFAVNPVAVYWPGITTYNWNFGDGFTATGQDPAAHTYPVNPTGGDVPYTITLTVRDHSNECSSTSTKTVTSYSENTANFNPQGSFGCNPYTVNFVNTSFNSTNYLWEFGDGSTSNLATPPAKTFLNSTNSIKTYQVKLSATSNRGCTHDTTATINVYRYNNADFAIDKTAGCSPLSVNVINNSRGGQYYWFWDDDDLTLASRDKFSTNDLEPFEVIYTNTSGVTETHNLTVIAFNGNCYDTLKREITVYSSITADFDFVQNNACDSSEVIFTNTSIGGGSYVTNWNFGDGTSKANPSTPFSKYFKNNDTFDKTYTVTLSAMSENGCPDTHQENITVWSRVEANFNIPISQGCPDAATQLFPATIQNTSIGNAANTYQWFIDGVLVPTAPTNKDNFVHNYFNDQPAPRTYNIRLVATNPHGCSTEKTGTITVFEYVDALFSITNPAGCTPWDVELVNQSTAPATNTNYLWDYGDNTSSGISDPIHTHIFYNESRQTDKPYTISLKVTSQNYCSDVFTAAPVTIYHQPLARFYVDPKSSCPPLIATMDNLGSRGYSMYRWEFGDGTTSPDIFSTVGETRSYTYPNTSINVTQNYWLKLYVESNQGCWHMDSTMLNVFPDVIADFNYDLAGCSPFVANFTNNSTSPATQFYWDFKDGSNSNQEDVLHRFVNDTYFDKVFNVKLTATSDYNCWDTISKPVMVYAQPVAMFNPTPMVQTFPEARVQLNSVSNGQPWNYLWTFDDGQTSSSSTEIFHDYAHWAKRNIRLELQSTTSNCADTITRTIMIYPPAVNAAFTVDTDRGCEPLDVQFTAVASAYTEIYTYEWDFGDGSTGTGSTPIHLYNSAGTYYVKMTARGEGGEDYEYRTIRVYKNPKANFSLTPNNTTLNTDFQARVEFFNLSECAEIEGCNYLWKFGDGNTSTENQLVYNYTELGVYDVTLVASTKEQGCVDSMVVIGAVTVEGEGKIKFPNAFVPNQEEEPECTYELKSALDLEGYIFHPYYEGILEYELWIYNRWGELIFKSTDKNCGWNGYVDGKLAKQDVYVWKAQGKFTNGKAFELAGDVTLIR